MGTRTPGTVGSITGITSNHTCQKAPSLWGGAGAGIARLHHWLMTDLAILTQAETMVLSQHLTTMPLTFPTLCKSQCPLGTKLMRFARIHFHPDFSLLASLLLLPFRIAINKTFTNLVKHSHMWKNGTDFCGCFFFLQNVSLPSILS